MESQQLKPPNTPQKKPIGWFGRFAEPPQDKLRPPFFATLRMALPSLQWSSNASAPGGSKTKSAARSQTADSVERILEPRDRRAASSGAQQSSPLGTVVAQTVGSGWYGYIFICMHIHVHMYMCVYVYIVVHTYIYIYIYIYIFVYTYIYTYQNICSYGLKLPPACRPPKGVPFDLFFGGRTVPSESLVRNRSEQKSRG